MDPLSVLSIAGQAWSAATGAFQVASTLYTFFQEAKQLDKTAEAFTEEIKALGAACEVVSNRLTVIVKDHEASVGPGSTQPMVKSGQLGACLESQIKACQATILDLKEAASPAAGVSKDTKFFNKAVKQLKLNMKSDDITEARERIKSHTTGLQTVLLSISIEVSYLAPQRADQQLQTQLADLAEKNRELSALLAKGIAATSNDAALLQASNQVVSSGQTLYNGSVAGGTVVGGIDPSASASIQDWLKHANTINSHQSYASTDVTSDSGSIFSSSTNAPGGGGTNTTWSSIDPMPQCTSPDASQQPPLADDVDSDDEFLVDAINSTISSGRQAFDQSHYQDAFDLFQEAFKMVLELPVKQQGICNTTEVIYMLGVCSYHLQDPATAKSALIGVIDARVAIEDDVRRRQVCNAGQLLAQTCIKLGELDQARTYCDSALQGYRRLLGKTHETTYGALALMIRILELQNNVSRARALARMIPPDHQSLTKQFADLNVMSGQTVSVPTAAATVAAATFPIITPQSTASPQLGRPSAPAIKTDTNITGPPTPSATSSNQKRRVYEFKHPDIRANVNKKTYNEPGPVDTADRRKRAEDWDLKADTELGKALLEGRDQDALVLVDQKRKNTGTFGVDEVLIALLQKKGGPDPHRREKGSKVISIAAAHGSVEAVKALIPSAKDSEITSAMQYAAHSSSLGVIDYLLDRGANPLACACDKDDGMSSTLHQAIMRDCLPLVKALSSAKSALSQKCGITAEDLPEVGNISAPGTESYYTCLTSATSTVSARDFEKIDKISLDALGTAVLANATDSLRYLVERGAPHGTKDRYVMSDYLAAKGIANKGFTKVGLSSTARWTGVMNDDDREGWFTRDAKISALGLAAAAQHSEIVDILLETAKPGAYKDDDALIYAIQTDNEEITCKLIDGGLSVDHNWGKLARKQGMGKAMAKWGIA